MQITRSTTEPSTAPVQGPVEWFTGAVYIDTVVAAVAPSRAQAAHWGQHVTDAEYHGPIQEASCAPS
jgi:hypothetical protein